MIKTFCDLCGNDITYQGDGLYFGLDRKHAGVLKFALTQGGEHACLDCIKEIMRLYLAYDFKTDACIGMPKVRTDAKQ